MSDDITHRLFLFIVTQLMTRGRIKTFIEGRNVSFCIDKRSGKWILSTQVVASNEKVSKTLKECFNSPNQIIYPHKNSFRFEDEDQKQNVYYEQEIGPINKYIAFRKLIKQFLDEAKDWKEILN